MYQRTVLIVEDEPMIRMILADALEDEGYGVLEAETILEAAAVLGCNGVDAVITDIDMPGALSGLDLARFLHTSKRTLPMIITSGGHNEADCSLPNGAIFISKPYSIPRMIELLDVLFKAGKDATRSVNRIEAA